MKIDKEYIERNIYLVEEFSYYDAYPYKDGFVIGINPTGTFEKKADKIRIAKGYKPFFTYDGEYDADGWYDFWVVLKRNCCEGLHFTVEYADGNEDEDYKLELTEEQLKWLYERICELLGENRVKELFA